MISKALKEYILMREKQYDEICKVSVKSENKKLINLLYKQSIEINDFMKRYPKFNTNNEEMEWAEWSKNNNYSELTRDGKFILKYFQHIVRFKRTFSLWWQNEIERIVKELFYGFTELKEKDIKLMKKRIKDYEENKK